MISIFFREVDFLLAGQQRDFAHLREVHAHGIVDPLVAGLGEFLLKIGEIFIVVLFFLDGVRVKAVFVGGLDDGLAVGADDGDGLLLARLDRGGRADGLRGHLGDGLHDHGAVDVLLVLKVFDIVLVDELDAHLVDDHEQAVETIGADHFIGKLGVELFVREVAAAGAEVEQCIHAADHLFR